ncbi:MAG: squalene--hopene cyclase [Phycisphaerae bacterium]|nr:squalene--hopene cyclase [Phycisphaerae bacterium]
MTVDRAAIDAALSAACDELLSWRVGGSHWRGALASSALATATAAFALGRVAPRCHAERIDAAFRWLVAHANADGGYGDSPRSASNLSTTLLVWSALAGRSRDDVRAADGRAAAWIARAAGGLDAATLARAVEARYGRDRTFAVPILTMAAMSGRLGEGQDVWRHVRPLPFELAVCPRRWFRRLRLPVVSYALPALIAVGRARYAARPPRCPFRRLLRRLTVAPTMRVLRATQPPGGGFLEAAPLTAFVLMCLTAAGDADSAVAAEGAGFLLRTQRGDGSWPVDTDLATWVTTLSVNALSAAGELRRLSDAERHATRRWLCAQQHTRRHPYTDAAPGGWAWTDLAGGVPDADDTAGTMRALHALGADATNQRAVRAASGWLAGLQNADGGIPTFCRGWGTLAFDRSAPDLTAHALAAWSAAPGPAPRRAMERAVRFLARKRRADGSWLPLWFANEAAAEQANPTYGTARVVAGLGALVDAGASGRAAPAVTLARRLRQDGVGWLLRAQQADGGWGGDAAAPASIEETGVAVEALARAAEDEPDPAVSRAVARGAGWLVDRTSGGRTFPPAPIGLYFAKLGYFERLYPVIFTVAALGRARRLLGS